MTLDNPTDAEKLAHLGTDTVRWAEALVDRFDIQTDDIGEVYGWTANMIMAGKDEEAQKSHALIKQLCEAIRLTREYVGEATLPPIVGWSWFDALVAAGRLTDDAPTESDS
jgi:hypothetical protein